MKTFLKDFFRGIALYGRAHRVIFRHRLWPLVLLPGLLSLLYVGLLISLGLIYAGDISAYIYAHWLPEMLKYDWMRFFTMLLIWLLILLAGYISYKTVILIICAPILGYLSEKVEFLLYGQHPPDFQLKTFLNDLLRSLAINLRNLAWSLLFTFAAWPFLFIPVLGEIVFALLMFQIQSYYSGYGLLDIVLERKRYSAGESLQFQQRQRGIVNGVGAGFTLLMLVPFAGWFLAPSYGAVAGTLAALEKTSGPILPERENPGEIVTE